MKSIIQAALAALVAFPHFATADQDPALRLKQLPDGVQARCAERLTNEVSKLSEIDQKLPGIQGNVDWRKRDLSALVDQDKQPTRDEREHIYHARKILFECQTEKEALQRGLLHSQLLALRDANRYHAFFLWFRFLNEPTTYGEFNQLRLKLLEATDAEGKDLERQSRSLNPGQSDKCTLAP